MHVHLIGVCGTGMGSLAGLLHAAGHHVSGSDRAFDPPMGDALLRWGIELKRGYRAENLTPRPDCVVIGNVCRADNPEARAAIEQDIEYMSMPKAVHDYFLAGRTPFVIAGTHGKTTTTSLLAFLLDRCGQQPGFLIGGLPQDFSQSFRIAEPGKPFVIEGDEYDSAFFEKSPKFFQYAPQVAALNAIELDHIDIYPNMNAYRAAFAGLVARMPDSGLLFAYAGDAEVRAIVANASCQVRYFAGSQDDCGGVTPDYLVIEEAEDRARFVMRGRESPSLSLSLSGAHNLRNALVAMAMAYEGAGVPLDPLYAALPEFRGVRRRQELRGEPRGIRVYDDFAHHPTAVAETLAGLRKRHSQGKLFAVFEPRSATASRGLHQDSYPQAFAYADVTLLAPVGRSEIPEAEKLDVGRIATEIAEGGKQAHACASVEEIIATLVAQCQPGDTIVIMSNGAFHGIHERLLQALAYSSPA